MEAMKLNEEMKQLTARERQNLAEWLRKLIEIDKCGAALELSYSSIFAYILGELKYSEGTAGKRSQAVKACKLKPRLLELIAENKMTLSAVSRISYHLEKDYADDLIERSVGLSTRPGKTHQTLRINVSR
jgi:hypothetical protein